MANLAIYCTLSRVPPLDHDSKLGASLLLSASWLGGVPVDLEDDPRDHWLALWKWVAAEATPSFRAWALVGGAWVEIAGIEPIAWPADSDGRIDNVRMGAGNLLQRLEDDSLTVSSVKPDGDDETTESGDEVHVRHLLADLSVQPAPAPQDLRLSWLARMPLSANASRLVVAPVLGGMVPSEPVSDPPHKMLQLDYPAAPFTLTGHVRAIDLNASTVADCVKENGWVVCPSGNPVWTDGDAVREIEARWPEFVDHSRQLLRSAVSALEPKGPLDADIVAALRRAQRAVARDRAGLGVATVSIETEDLVDLIIGEGATGLPTEEKLRTALGTWEENLDEAKWRGLLRAALEQGRPPEEDLDPAAPDSSTLLRELSAMLSEISNPAVAARLVEAQWSDALQGDEHRAAVLALLRRVISDLDLPGLLRELDPREAFSKVVELARPKEKDFLERLPTSVASLVPDNSVAFVPDKSRLAARLEDSSRFPTVSAKDQGTLADVSAQAASLIEPEVRSLIERFHKETSDPALGPGTATERPHPVAVPVTSEGVEEARDVFEFVQGFGLLLRRHDEASASRWRCLNLARLELDGDGGEVADSAVVPLRLGYENGVRQSRLSYDNQPLAALSPAEKLAGRRLDRDPDDTTGVSEEMALDDTDAWLDRGPVPLPGGADDDGNWGLLPGLVFGRRYQAAPFAVFNGGVLPLEVRDPAEPTRLLPWASADAVKPGEIREIDYRRRVPLGAPRLVGLPQTTRLDDVLPPIPPHVAPRARELTDEEREPFAPPPPTSFANPGKPLKDPLEGVADGVDPPLVLLTPDPSWQAPDGIDRKKVSFTLGRPGVDIATWDRWEAIKGEEVLHEREANWASFYRQIDRGLPPPSFDDPAVARKFFLTWGEDDSLVEKTISGEILELTIESHPEVTEIGTATSSDTKASCLLWARVGSICLLRVQVGVPDAERPRFHPDLETGARGTRADGDGVIHVLGPPADLLVEVADKPAWAADPEEHSSALFAAMTVEEVQREDGPRLSLSLAAPQQVEPFDEILRDASGFEVLRQTWRWDGRIHDGFPLTVAGTSPRDLVNDDSYQQWAATSFATRDDEDAVVEAGLLSRVEETHQLLELPRVGDPKALLYRVGVTVRSRYAGTAPAGVRWLALQASTRLDDSASTPTTWLPVFDGSRREDAIPRPNLKLVVPLTEGREEEFGSAPLLAVLREPWYEAGGLAEELLVEIEQAPVFEPFVPEDDAPLPSSEPLFQLPEHGPDPLITGDAWRSVQPDPVPLPRERPDAPEENRQVIFRPRGPLGYTFDTDSSAPLFIHSGFFLDRPAVPAWAAERDLSHNMSKIRFRRRLDPEGRRWPTPNGGGWLAYADRFKTETVTLAAGKARCLFKGATDPGLGLAHRVLLERLVVDGCGRLTATLRGTSESEVEVELQVHVDHAGKVAWSGSVTSNQRIELGGLPPTGDFALELRRPEADRLEVVVAVRAGTRQRAAERSWRALGSVILTASSAHPLGLTAKADSAEIEFELRYGEFPSAASDDPEQRPVPLIESSATTPTWVQLLPSADAWELGSKTEDGRFPVFSTEALAIFRKKADSATQVQLSHEGSEVNAVRSRTGPPPAEVREGYLASVPCLLITEMIHDARGRQDERFVLLAPVADGSCQLESDPEGRLRGRLVEVQRIAQNDGALDAGSVLEELFPTAIPGGSVGQRTDAKARILRVSRPIDEV